MPVPKAVIYVPAVIPVPVRTTPTESTPEVTPVTLSLVPAPPNPLLMVAVTSAVEAAPIDTKSVVPIVLITYGIPTMKLPAVCNSV